MPSPGALLFYGIIRLAIPTLAALHVSPGLQLLQDSCLQRFLHAFRIDAFPSPVVKQQGYVMFVILKHFH